MRRGAAVLAVLAATILGACGATPLSVTQLRSSATRACQQAVRQGNRIPGPSSPATSAAFLRGGVLVLTHELAGLRTLQPPSTLAGNYAAAVSAVSQQLTIVRDTIRRLDAGADPVSSFKLMQTQLAPLEARGSAAWQALGIPACVNQ